LLGLSLPCKTELVRLDILNHLGPLLADPPVNDEDQHNIYVEDGLLLEMIKLGATLASQDENQMIMANKGLIPSILAQTNHEIDDIKYHVARGIANLALNPQNQIMIAESAGVKAMLGLTQAATKEYRDEVAETIIESEPLHHIQEEALRGLWNLCSNSDNQTAVAEMGGIEMICELLKASGNVRVRSQCAGAIANLALTDTGRDALLEQDAHEYLMELMYEEEEPLAARNAASALSNLALEDETRKQLFDMGVVETMKIICQTTDAHPDAQRGAAGVLWNIAISAENRANMAEEGVVEVLLALAHTDNSHIPGVQEPAAGCLSLLCMEKEIRERVLSSGLFENIIFLTKSADDRVMTAAAEVIERFLIQEHMEVLEELGAVAALQMYARGIVRRRRQMGKDKKMSSLEFPKAPEPHRDKGIYSFATPPPHYRPVTPAPLYEVDAMEWWPNTQSVALSRGGTGAPDPYVAGSDLEYNSAEHALEDGHAVTEANIFFCGDKLATPARPVNAQGDQTPGFRQTTARAESPMRSKVNTPASARGSTGVLSGRAQSRSSGPQRFYF